MTASTMTLSPTTGKHSPHVVGLGAVAEHHSSLLSSSRSGSLWRNFRASLTGRALSTASRIGCASDGSRQHSGTPQPSARSHRGCHGLRANASHTWTDRTTAPDQKLCSAAAIALSPAGDIPGSCGTCVPGDKGSHVSARSSRGDLRGMVLLCERHGRQCPMGVTHGRP